MRLASGLVAAVGLLAAACGGSAQSSPTSAVAPQDGPGDTPGPKLQVVSTIPVLADFARNVGGVRVEVSSIVPPGADIHSFQTAPGHSVALGTARLIVSNGRGLDTFLDGLIPISKSSHAVHVVAALGLEDSAELSGSLAEEGDVPQGEGGPGYEYLAGDPHLWLNPLYAVHYVERIRDGLVDADPDWAHIYDRNAADYIRKLRDLDREIAGTLSQVPVHRRHLVSFHDAFSHFARQYGWRASAFVRSDAGEVTPGRVVSVMENIRADGIPLVFAEPQLSSDILYRAAADAGVRVGAIYSDIIDGVTSYIEMMRFNATSLSRLGVEEVVSVP